MHILMESHDQHEFGKQSTTKRGWQFSLLGLFVVTTIISVCLAFGVSFPRIAVAVVAIGLVQAGILYLGDWLIRSRGGRTLNRVTSIVRAIFGTALLATAASMATSNAGALSFILAYLIGAIGLLCWILAWRRWS